jgi:hypothetical protein
VFVFAFIWTFGGFLVVLSWFLKNLVSLIDGLKGGWIAWNLDGKLQQNRIALRSLDYQELIGGDDDVPYTEKEVDLQPFKEHFVPRPRTKEEDGGETINKIRGGTMYVLITKNENATQRGAQDVVAEDHGPVVPPAPTEGEESRQRTSRDNRANRQSLLSEAQEVSRPRPGEIIGNARDIRLTENPTTTKQVSVPAENQDIAHASDPVTKPPPIYRY